MQPSLVTRAKHDGHEFDRGIPAPGSIYIYNESGDLDPSMWNKAFNTPGEAYSRNMPLEQFTTRLLEGMPPELSYSLEVKIGADTSVQTLLTAFDARGDVIFTSNRSMSLNNGWVSISNEKKETSDYPGMGLQSYKNFEALTEQMGCAQSGMLAIDYGSYIWALQDYVPSAGSWAAVRQEACARLHALAGVPENAPIKDKLLDIEKQLAKAENPAAIRKVAELDGEVHVPGGGTGTKMDEASFNVKNKPTLPLGRALLVNNVWEGQKRLHPERSFDEIPPLQPGNIPTISYNDAFGIALQQAYEAHPRDIEERFVYNAYIVCQNTLELQSDLQNNPQAVVQKALQLAELPLFQEVMRLPNIAAIADTCGIDILWNTDDPVKMIAAVSEKITAFYTTGENINWDAEGHFLDCLSSLARPAMNMLEQGRDGASIISRQSQETQNTIVQAWQQIFSEPLNELQDFARTKVETVLSR